MRQIYWIISFLIILSFIGKANSQLLEPPNSEDPLNLSQYSGKTVYIDFWASWCIPCRKSFPWLNKIRTTYSNEELVIIGVNLDKERAKAEAFLKEYPAKFDIFYDPKGILAEKYQLQGMPSSILINPHGQIVSAHSGFFQSKVSLYENEIQASINNYREVIREK